MAFRNRVAIAVFAATLIASSAVFSQESRTDSTVQNSSDTTIQTGSDLQNSSPEVRSDSLDAPLQQQLSDSTQQAQPQIETTTSQQVSNNSQKINAIQESPVKKYKSHLMGVGADLGFQFFSPTELNDFLENVYDEMKEGYLMISEVGTPKMFLGFNFGGHIMVRPIPWLAVGGIGRYFFATKKLAISTSGSGIGALSDPDFSSSVRDGIIGGKVETFINPTKTVTLKGGFSVEAHFATVELEQLHTVTLTGNGVGVTPFIGLSIAPGRGIALINVDFMFPICNIDLDEIEGKFYSNSDPYAFDNGTRAFPLPKELKMTGFIIKPSITICFP